MHGDMLGSNNLAGISLNPGSLSASTPYSQGIPKCTKVHFWPNFYLVDNPALSEEWWTKYFSGPFTSKKPKQPPERVKVKFCPTLIQ